MSGTSCSVKISGLRTTKYLRYFVYSEYFGFVYCKILYEDSEYFGLVYSGILQVDTVDTPCISSISWFCTAGTPRTGRFSSVEIDRARGHPIATEEQRRPITAMLCMAEKCRRRRWRREDLLRLGWLSADLCVSTSWGGKAINSNYS